MKTIVGNIKFIRPSQKDELARLSTKRSRGYEIISPDIAIKTGALCSNISAQLGLLINREGRIVYVIVGTRDRLYLPDLGRFRLDSARLRKLRLVVFTPDRYKTQHSFNYIITADLITDLEKLRLDAVLVVTVDENGHFGLANLAHLGRCPSTSKMQKRTRVLSRRDETGITILAWNSFSDIAIDFNLLVEELELAFYVDSKKGHATGDSSAVLVGAYTYSLKKAQASMDELKQLAKTAGIFVVDSIIQRRQSLDPKTLIGKGKIEEIVLHCLKLGAELLVFDSELSPGQLRSIANLTELKVIDRSMLILDIFAQRAKSAEGRLQVELAQLKYSLPRLTEKDTGLSRLTGGIGGRGPGETKLEVSRRRVRDRISLLEKQIDKLSSQRFLRREKRQVRGVPVIALVGYTNAGKSSLLNTLTKSKVFADNKLFATLDPSSKRMRFPNDYEVILVDTVGFIRDLPKELFNAFRSTLEEVGEANYLLQVVDASSPELFEEIEIVQRTLDELGYGNTSRILLLNKCDLLSQFEKEVLVGRLGGLAVSALTKEGLKELVLALQSQIARSFSGQDPGRFTEIRQWNTA